MTKSGTTIQYEYNHEGLRTQKIVTANGTTDATHYTYNGKNVVHVIRNSDHLHIFYDAQSRPAKVSFNGALYTYIHNLQGDIVGILDGSGALVVEYKYDAWGKPINTTGALADTLGKSNPFRYRGYVYDEETGLYYLWSRYYDPEWGRFVNADMNLGKKGVLLSHSSYTYCLNLLIGYADADGTECQQCIEGIAISYEVFTLDRDQMAIFATWLLGEYPIQPVDNPFQVAVGNLIGVGSSEALDTLAEMGNSKLLKSIPGLGLAYDIITGAVQPYAEYEAESANWLMKSFGLGTVATKAERAEITCFFGHWTTEIGIRFYDINGKLVGTALEEVSPRLLRKTYSTLNTYFDVKHGHPNTNMTLSDLYKAKHISGGGGGLIRYSCMY